MALLRSVATVGSYTLVSRVFGFIRDILTAAILGAGPVADAFFVAQRLPNLFRSLFAEGAFNAAFVPLASGALAEGGKPAVKAFAEDAFSVLFAVLLAFVLLGEMFMPWLMTVIAPGFSAEPGKFDLVVTLTRITFPYLLFISLTALQGGLLNAVDRFAAPAATPILLNLFLIAGLLLMTHFHWQDGEVLAWALSTAGLAQFLWLMVSCAHAGVGFAASLAAADPAGQADLADHGAGRPRGRRHTAQSDDFDRARLAIAGRLGVVPLLRRPAEPAAARRRGHRRGDGDPAALVAPGAHR
jgi:putative peptidoglycan lipid II flippase